MDSIIITWRELLLVLAAVSALARSVADPGVQPAEQSLAAQARSE
jgi:hypothetical protein